MYTPAWLVVVLLMTWGLGSAQPNHSSYAGQAQQELKALSEGEIQALLHGRGMGLAKAAEMNHYPGPLHVLELAAPLHLSEPQRMATQQLYDRMHAEAVRLGELIIAQEQELERLFAHRHTADSQLPGVVREIARLQGELRLVHLQAHVDMRAILALEQIAAYDTLRGYGAGGQPSGPAKHQPGRH